MALGVAFTDMALGSALVQRKEITSDDETSVFWMNVTSGTILTLLLCAISPFVAAFFRQPVLTGILCAQAGVIFISAFGAVQKALITRTMSFRINTVIQVAAAAVSGIVGVVAAFSGLGVWSLVLLNLVNEFTTLVLLWVLRDWRPRGHFRWSCVKSMWDYSSKLLYASLVHRVVTNLYSILVGRFYAPAALGLYTRANSFQAMPTGMIVGIVQRVSFPLFCRNQDNPSFLLQTIRRNLRVLSFATIFVLTWIALIADELIPFLIGDKWLGAISLTKILCLAGVCATTFPLHSQMVQALGMTGIFFRNEMIKKVVIVVAVLVAYPFGITALAWSAVVVSVTDYLLSAWPNVKAIGYTWGMQAGDILSPFLLGMLGYGASIAVAHFVSAPLLVLMILKSAVLCVVVCAGVFLLRSSVFSDVFGLIRQALCQMHLLPASKDVCRS